MSITQTFNEIKNDEQFWSIFPKISNINKKLSEYGTLEDKVAEMLAETIPLFIKKDTWGYCPKIFIKNFNKQRKEVFIGICQGRFLYIENNADVLKEFNSKSHHFYFGSIIPKIIVKKQISNVSEYDGLFNIIFDNKEVGDFVFDNLTEHGQEAFTNIYNEYMKYTFEKDIIVRRNIKIEKGKEDNDIFNAEHPKNNLNISAYSKTISLKYNEWVKDKYVNMVIPLIRNVLSVQENENHPIRKSCDADTLKRKILQDHFFDAYLFHINAPKVLSAIDEIDKEYTENIKDYFQFLTATKDFLTKYYMLTKL